MTGPLPAMVGIDGCPGGWLAVSMTEGSARRARIYATFRELLDEFPADAQFGIDIPMGLPAIGPRACEREARQRLGRPRSSSVFSAPLRDCLAATTYEEACEIRFGIEGKRMSRQAFGILPKIREVDTALAEHPEWVPRVIEVHPEVSFACWNHGSPMAHRKKSAEGKAERRALIESVWPGELDRVRPLLKGGKYALDDLHDAFAALWTVRRWVAGSATTLGRVSEKDGNGLPMRIVA